MNPLTSDRISIFRSPNSHCWRGDLENAAEDFSDRELAEIAEHGFTGIWIHQKLSDYTPSRIFSSFGKDSEGYLKLLEELIARAARHGLQVYMYLLEPRALEVSDPAWAECPEARGRSYLQPVYEKEFNALCSSHPTVRAYLRESIKLVAERLPGLGGFLAISAGEDFTTCCGKLCSEEVAEKLVPGFSRIAVEKDLTCPRCLEKSIPEVIATVLNDIHAGLVDAKSKAKLVAWDWGWDHLPGASTQAEIISLMHPDIIFISDFEIGAETEVLGRMRAVEEYCLGYVGPSPRFLENTGVAQRTGHRIGVKLQVGTTHELATVPNLPLINNLCRKVEWLNAHQVNVTLATWNIGTIRTLNTYVFGRTFGVEGAFSIDSALEDLVPSYLGVTVDEVATLRQAWRHFEKGMESYPYGGRNLLYFGPTNYAPAYWLPARQTSGRGLNTSWDLREHSDKLEDCLGSYTEDELVGLYGRLIEEWKLGLDLYHEVLDQADGPHAREELNSAECACHVFRSMAHIFALFKICRHWTGSEEELAEYRELCEGELGNCEALLPLLQEDSRLGLHHEFIQSMFNQNSVGRKIAWLRALVEDPTTPRPAEGGLT